MSLRKFVFLSLTLILGQTLAINVYSAQSDYYLKIDGVDGKITLNEEGGWIHLLAIDFETDIESTNEPSKTGKTDFTNFQLVREVDEISPILFDVFASGKVIPEGKLLFCENERCSEPISLSDIQFFNFAMESGDVVVERIRVSTNFDLDSDKSQTVIPSWIKNNAKWYAEGSIGDSDFTKGIEYMIKEKIMNIPNLPEMSSEDSQASVPEWIKNNAKWWSDGQISDDDFVKGIQYLVEKGIIKIK